MHAGLMAIDPAIFFHNWHKFVFFSSGKKDAHLHLSLSKGFTKKSLKSSLPWFHINIFAAWNIIKRLKFIFVFLTSCERCAIAVYKLS